MVKVSDRMVFKAKQDTLDLYLNAFDNTLSNRAFPEAERLMAIIENLGVPLTVIDSLHLVYERTRAVLIDSLLQIAQAFEDSSKFADAAYYYQQLVDVDSLNTAAREKVAEMNVILAKEEAASKPPAKTAAELEKMYNKAVSKFLAEDYNTAYKLFKVFLGYRPGHEGAKDYYERTKARLKALE